MELPDCCRHVERQVEHGEAAGRVPATTVQSCSLARESGPTGGHVAICARLICRRGLAIEGCDGLGEVHGSDEDALGECVDHREHATKLSLGEQVDGLVVIEHAVRREQPVVPRSGLEDA